MATFGLILVGLDESEPAQAAQGVAIELAAHEPSSRLLFCHVVDTGTLYDRAATFGYDPQPIATELESSARPILARAVEVAKERGVAAQDLLLDGDPLTQFLSCGAQRQPGLIVLGSHGRSGLQRLFLGSFAEAVVRRAACPVLVVRTAAEQAPAFHRILVPVDASAPSQAALQLAIDLARAHGGQLTLLHATAFMRVLALAAAPDDGFVDADAINEALRASGQAIVDLASAAARSAGVEANIRVDERSPLEAIDAVAHEIAADVIVMGTHGRHGVPRLFLGSTTERVLRVSTIPVLVVRGRA